MIQVPPNRGQRKVYSNNEDRADITAFNISNGINFAFDIAMARPLSKDIVKRASEEIYHGADKGNKYEKQLMPANRGSSKVCFTGL